jgi:thiosulfate/3-mercaptopyruvate sulfurtransferase
MTTREISAMPTLRLAQLTAAALIAALATTASAQPSARSRIIVTTDWLATHLHDQDLVLLHVGDKSDYDKAHIPGARLVSLRDISVSSHDHEKDTGLMLEMPAPDSLRTQLAALGISDRSRVVVYYGGDWVSPATRVVFTLDYAGLGDRSALLDGGINAWKAAGQPVTSDIPSPTVGQLSALRIHPIVVDAGWVRSRLGSPSLHLIDGRAAVFYDGVEATAQRKGHVAGARSIPFTEITDDKLHIKPAEQLAALFTNAGVGPRDTVVAYCHIGQQATAVLFAARSLGHPVLLYDGSFQDWGRHGDYPVDNPAAGGAQKP